MSVVNANHFVLFGGYDGTTWLNDMHHFDFETGEWAKVAVGRLGRTLNGTVRRMACPPQLA